MNARIVIVCIMCLSVLFQLQVVAQKNKDKEPEVVETPVPESNELDVNKAIYRQAMSYGDYNAASNAVYRILAQGGAASYKDTLAFLYFNAGSYVQAILVSDDILKQKPNDLAILEITAVSQQNLGLPKEALASYEKLYAQDPDIFHLYNIASLQYTLKRFGECGNTLDAILKSEDNNQEITITNNNGQSQKVPIKAAGLNMLGVMALELQQNEVAQKSFEEAIKIAPDFALAQGNLQRMLTAEAAPESQPKK